MYVHILWNNYTLIKHFIMYVFISFYREQLIGLVSFFINLRVTVYLKEISHKQLIQNPVSQELNAINNDTLNHVD